jgi:predicted  nucleic acid-binding Zn-ribbon protein
MFQGQFTKQKKDHEDELEALRSQLTEAESRVAQQTSVTNDQLTAEQRKVDELNSVVASLRSQFAGSVAELSVVNTELLQLRDARDTLAGDVSVLKSKLASVTLAAAEEAARLSGEIAEQKLQRVEDAAKLKQLQRKLDEQLDELMSTKSALEHVKSNAAKPVVVPSQPLTLALGTCSVGVAPDTKPGFLSPSALPVSDHSIPSLPQTLPSVRARSFAAGGQSFGGDAIVSVSGSGAGEAFVDADDDNDDSDKSKPPALLAHCGVALQRARTNPKGFFKSATGIAISYILVVHMLLIWYIRHC